MTCGCFTAARAYLIYVENLTQTIKDSVQGVEHVDHLQRCSCRANRREANDIGKKHCHVINLARGQGLSWKHDKLRFLVKGHLDDGKTDNINQLLKY